MLLARRRRRSESLVTRLNAAAGGSANVAAMFLYGINATTAGGTLSAWADANGTGNTISQATGSKQPADSASDYVFDGVDDSLRGAFSWVQPCLMILVVKQVSFTSLRFVADGFANSLTLRQFAPSPGISSNIGTLPNNTDLVIGTYGVVSCKYTGSGAGGAGSDVQVNNNTAQTGSAVTTDPGGITLAAQSNGTNASNIAVKAALCLNGGVTAPQRQAVLTLLYSAYGITP